MDLLHTKPNTPIDFGTARLYALNFVRFLPIFASLLLSHSEEKRTHNSIVWCKFYVNVLKRYSDIEKQEEKCK